MYIDGFVEEELLIFEGAPSRRSEDGGPSRRSNTVSTDYAKATRSELEALGLKVIDGGRV